MADAQVEANMAESGNQVLRKAIDVYADLIGSITGMHATMILNFVALGPMLQILSADLNHNPVKTYDLGKVLFLLLNGIEKSQDPYHEALGLKGEADAKHTRLDDEPLHLLAMDVEVRNGITIELI